jgi:hypothetical protein
MILGVVKVWQKLEELAAGRPAPALAAAEVAQT